MAVAYLYIVGASKSPDRIECAVPWRVDDEEIFFGPCKTPLREKLRPELLGPETDRAVPEGDIYFVGFNALGVPRARKLVWAGRMREAMSFGRAWIALDEPRYAKMRDESGYSPLHLVPLDGSGRPTGYRQRGREHLKNGAWVSDVVDDELRAGAVVAGREVRLLPHKTWWTGFSRDICFRFENLFFATDGGLDIDEQLVKILADAQPDREGVGSLAIFGLNSAGDPEGRRGRWLELRGDELERFVAWLEAKVSRRPKGRRSLGPAARSEHPKPKGCR